MGELQGLVLLTLMCTAGMSCVVHRGIPVVNDSNDPVTISNGYYGRTLPAGGADLLDVHGETLLVFTRNGINEVSSEGLATGIVMNRYTNPSNLSEGDILVIDERGEIRRVDAEAYKRRAQESGEPYFYLRRERYLKSILSAD